MSNPEAARAERNSANLLRAYPALAAYHTARAAWFEAPEGKDPPDFTKAAGRDQERQKRDIKAADRAHRDYQSQFSENDYI